MKSLQYFLLLLLNIFFISLNLIIIFNKESLSRVFASANSGYSTYVIYVVLVILFVLNIVINYRHIKNYKKDYIKEIILISRVGYDSLKRLPLIYTAVIINITAIFSSWILSYICYKYIYMSFNRINIVLLLILLTGGIGNSFLTCHYIFRLK